MNSRPRRSLRVVCALGVLAGVVLTGLGAWTSDLTTLGVGLLLVFVAGVGRRVFRTLARIKARLRETNEQIQDLRAGLGGGESAISQSFETMQDDPDTPTLEMLSLGGSDPRMLTAATLGESTFPRLATLLNEAAVESASELHGSLEHDPTEAAPAEAAPAEASPTVLPMYDESDDATPAVVPMYDESDETELRLRQEFSQLARRRDYAGLLDVGRRICQLLPDRPIAAEYERLEPALIRRAAAAQTERDTHTDQPSSTDQQNPTDPQSPGAIVFDHPKRASG